MGFERVKHPFKRKNAGNNTVLSSCTDDTIYGKYIK